MARREDIVNTFWDDVDHLSDDAVMLYVWSWTNTKCGMAGIYRVPERKLLEGRLTPERIRAALAELETDGKLRYVDGVLWNCARVKRLSGISKNYAKSIARDVREVWGNPLAAEFMARYGTHPKLEEVFIEQGLAKGSERVLQPLDRGSDLACSADSKKGFRKGSERDHGPGQGLDGEVSPYDKNTIVAEV